MYRDDLEATHARAEALQRELAEAQTGQIQDKQRISALSAQLSAAQQALQRLGGAISQAQFILPPRGSTILVLGILSLVLCSVLGPVAWAMGNEEMRRIDAGQVDPMSRGSVTAGRICGIIATALMIVGVVLFLAVFATISTTTRHYY